MEQPQQGSMQCELYVACWYDAAGLLHHGQPMSKEDAQGWADIGNRDWPALRHFVVSSNQVKKQEVVHD